jgi:hypothetical protein
MFEYPYEMINSYGVMRVDDRFLLLDTGDSFSLLDTGEFSNE